MPAEIFVYSFVVEDQFSQIESELLDTAISQGFEETFQLVTNSPNFSKNFEFIFVNQNDALGVLSGRINSISELEGLDKNQVFDPEQGSFAILISRKSGYIDVNSIFYSENGFKTN